MGSFGGYFKGEKKKKKKDQDTNKIGIAPVFVPPQVVGKGKKQES